MTKASNIHIFRPKLLDTLRGYDRRQFARDAMAGVIVGIVALPLAIAFAIASGVSPEKGLITAIVAGLLISALGGSRVQIGGPTGAFIVIVYGIVQQYGVTGLTIATLMAGVILILMGISRLGSVIQYIPYPLITGFTSGIALIIFSSQIKDLMGLHTGAVPGDFINKWKTYLDHLSTINPAAIALGLITVVIVLLWPRVTRKIPGSLVAVIVTTAAVQGLHLPVDTIGTRFGAITATLQRPGIHLPGITELKLLIQPAFTIALLGGIESLLSATVADGMIGGNYRPNTELIAQGIANMVTPLFGGIPATGAIARTATNIKNGGRTPVAGMIHALTLLLIMLCVGRWAVLIPMSTLAGILVVVAYNMSEWENFVSVLRGPKGDAVVLMTTFLLTVLVDLTVAIEIGMVLACFLFMRQMIRFSGVTITMDKEEEAFQAPAHVDIFEFKGPLFFGAAYKFKEAIKQTENPPRVLIIRMRYVPIVDTTGIRTLREIYKHTRKRGTRLILSEVASAQVMQELKDARLLFAVGKKNVTATFPAALRRANDILTDQPSHL
ncbi:SulP family inorganic anion transporter [Dinghuibacter silviterrae]|uniref:SulP family sulfate permease n=1 Tax=Dinghuibacter silviterrae TaxID=1539049 RepID=A0A4R8DGP1_9BACT|nr:SulP family inorganic anion transporter [Dinghuibacter silviterrae]TDW96841.1 SulP family sulfate permease [Dinghuibacter silviterrae]